MEAATHKNRKHFGPCAASSCDRPAVSKGFCDKHYRRILRHNTIVPSRIVDSGDAIQRFHQKYIAIPFCGCWIWTGGTRPNSRGVLYGRHWQDNGTSIGAHRFSWMTHFGSIPDGLFVCHRCDNTLCVNPDHLFLGTASDNAQDMVMKGRYNKARGEEKKGRAKLTNDMADSIRLDTQSSNAQLAVRYGVSETTIWRVRNRVSY